MEAASGWRTHLARARRLPSHYLRREGRIKLARMNTNEKKFKVLAIRIKSVQLLCNMDPPVALAHLADDHGLGKPF